MSKIMLSKSDEGIGVLTLNRPQVLNAMDWEAMESFAETVDSLHSENHLQALIVTGADGAFCSGGDLSELDNYLTREDGRRLSTLMGKALKRFEELPIPTLAAMEGPAIGGGAEIALACDLRVMAERAVLGLSHIRLAIIPAWGGGQRLLRLIGYTRAFEWLTSGRVVSAIEAHSAGLVNRLVPDGSALEHATEMAQSITKHASNAVKAIKSFLRAGISLPLDRAEALERSKFPDIWAAAEHIEASGRFVSRKIHQHVNRKRG
jgi:enoyl-CoA hydratase